MITKKNKVGPGVILALIVILGAAIELAHGTAYANDGDLDPPSAEMVG